MLWKQLFIDPGQSSVFHPCREWLRELWHIFPWAQTGWGFHPTALIHGAAVGRSSSRLVSIILRHTGIPSAVPTAAPAPPWAPGVLVPQEQPFHGSTGRGGALCVFVRAQRFLNPSFPRSSVPDGVSTIVSLRVHPCPGLISLCPNINAPTPTPEVMPCSHGKHGESRLKPQICQGIRTVN